MRNQIYKIWEKGLVRLFDNPLGRLYLGVPRGKRIYKITQSSVHYYTGELSKRNGLPVICTGNCSPGGRLRFIHWLETWKPIHLCWLFRLMGWKIPRYFIALDTGYKSPTTTPSPGSENDWTNPANAYASDDSYATVFSFSYGGAWLQNYGTFGFGIGAGDTINGIEIGVEHKEDAALDLNYIRLWWYCASDALLSDLAAITKRTTEQVDTAGGATSLWGRTPVGSDFSDANFYVRYLINNAEFSGTMYLNHIQVKVYYTAGPTTYYQTLPSIEVASPSIADIIGYSRTLAIAESSVLSLSKTIYFYISLVATEVSSLSMNLLKSFFKTLSIAENSVLNLAKGLERTLSVVESSVASLTKIITFIVSMTISEVSSVSISLVKSFYRVLSVAETSVINLVKGLYKSLSIAESSVATLAKAVSHYISLTITETVSLLLNISKSFYRILSIAESSVVDLIKGLGKTLSITETVSVVLDTGKKYYKALSAIELSVIGIASQISKFLSATMTSVNSIGLVKSFYKTLSVVESSAISLTKISSHYIALSIQEVSIITISLLKSFYRVLSVVENSLVSLAKKLIKTLSVQEVSIATLTVAKSFYRTLSATATSVLSIFQAKVLSLSKRKHILTTKDKKEIL